MLMRKANFKIDTSNKPRHFMDIPVDSFISFMMSFVLYFFLLLISIPFKNLFWNWNCSWWGYHEKGCCEHCYRKLFLKDCNKKCKLFILSCMIECKGMSGCLTECHAPAARRSVPPPSYTDSRASQLWPILSLERWPGLQGKGFRWELRSQPGSRLPPWSLLLFLSLHPCLGFSPWGFSLCI